MTASRSCTGHAGGVALLTAVIVMVTAAMSLAVITRVGTTLGDRARARTIAEFVAVARVDHGDAVAESVASANGAELTDMVAWRHHDGVSTTARVAVDVRGVQGSAVASNAPVWP